MTQRLRHVQPSINATRNRRRNPIDSTVAAATITDEQHTVAEFDELPGVYGFILEERPVAGTVSVRQDNTAETPFTIVLTSPLAGQVFVDFNENRGYCIFNSADNGKAILVTYDGSGANNTVENIRAIAGEEIDAQRNAASGLAEFNASRQLKLPNTAGTQTSLLTNANAAARTYTLPDKSGTVAMLDDISAPDLGPIIDDATVATSIDDTDKFAFARDASEVLQSAAWSLITSLLQPVGTIITTARTTAPTGFLACNGANVSRSTYASLFSAIGTTYGAGDGSTTFTLPDLRGLFVRGAGAHGTMTKAAGGAFDGGSVGSTSNDSMQGHYHDWYVGNTTSSFGHTDNNNQIAPADNAGGRKLQSDGTVTGSKDQIAAPKSDGTNGTPRTGNETKPASMSLLYCIKY